MDPASNTSRRLKGRLPALGLALSFIAGCGKDTRLTFTQTSKEGPLTYLLTPRQAAWANSQDGTTCLALTYQWDTHAGQFILEGVRSSYLRVVIRLPESITGPGSAGDYEMRPGMVQAYDDYTKRGICYTGGPGRINVRCDQNNKLIGSFEVKCRGFLPGRAERSLFSDDYILRANFDARPDAVATRSMVKEVGWFFATPKRTPVYGKKQPERS